MSGFCRTGGCQAPQPDVGNLTPPTPVSRRLEAAWFLGAEVESEILWKDSIQAEQGAWSVVFHSDTHVFSIGISKASALWPPVCSSEFVV